MKKGEKRRKELLGAKPGSMEFVKTLISAQNPPVSE